MIFVIYFLNIASYKTISTLTIFLIVSKSCVEGAF